MRHSNFAVIGLEKNTLALVIRDIGPWDKHPSITNDVEWVVDVLLRDRKLKPGQRLYYWDSDNQPAEILVKDGKFDSFKFMDLKAINSYELIPFTIKE